MFEISNLVKTHTISNEVPDSHSTFIIKMRPFHHVSFSIGYSDYSKKIDHAPIFEF